MGFRGVAVVRGHRCKLFSRNGREFKQWPGNRPALSLGMLRFRRRLRSTLQTASKNSSPRPSIASTYCGSRRNRPEAEEGHLLHRRIAETNWLKIKNPPDSQMADRDELFESGVYSSRRQYPKPLILFIPLYPVVKGEGALLTARPVPRGNSVNDSAVELREWECHAPLPRPQPLVTVGADPDFGDRGWVAARVVEVLACSTFAVRHAPTSSRSGNARHAG